MFHRLAPTVVLAALQAAAVAQGFAHNRLEFGNWWVSDREDWFPNYATSTGNVAGDGLFKVFPSELLGRGDALRITGYSLVVSVDDAYTGSYPVAVEVPAVQFYRTRMVDLAGGRYEVPDVSQPVGPRFNAIATQFSSDGAWAIEVLFDPSNTDPNTRAPLVVPNLGPGSGLAIMVLARAGERRSPTTPGVVMQSSFGERHFAPGRASYSGSYAANGGAIAMFGTAGMPSATGELYVGLRLQQPSLQLAGSSAGGVSPDPQGFETQLGPGAYATDLASRRTPGRLRLLVQDETFAVASGPPTHLAFPFVVAVGATPPAGVLDLGAARLLFDSGALNQASLLIDAGFFGGLGRVAAASGAGFDVELRGAWNSAELTVPNSPSLRGLHLWLQVLVTTVGLQPAAASNVVRLVLS